MQSHCGPPLVAGCGNIGGPQFIETVPRLGCRLIAPVDLTAVAPPKLPLEVENVVRTEIPSRGPTSSVAAVCR
jgi:hypothetical protein